MSGSSQVPDTPNLAMRGGRGGSYRLARGGMGVATGLSRPVAQCDLPTSDVTVHVVIKERAVPLTSWLLSN